MFFDFLNLLFWIMIDILLLIIEIINMSSLKTLEIKSNEVV